MVLNDNIELERKRQKLLGDIRRIVGRGFEFSDAYVKQINGYPRCGDGRPFTKVTNKYLYCPCRVVYGNNEEKTEYGASILKYSLYRRHDGKNVEKIELEDLFVSDLKKVYDEIVFCLWWETYVRYPNLKKQMEVCEKYVDCLNKNKDIIISTGDENNVS